MSDFSLSLGLRLRVAPSGPELIVTAGREFREIELPLTVAANVPWSLSIALPDGEEEPAVLAARDDTGEWRSTRNGGGVRVISHGKPTDPTEIRVRVRLASGAAVGSASRLRLVLEPAAGAPGNYE